MTELLTQKDYWNSRAKIWHEAPLIPSTQDLDFIYKNVVPNGDTLLLGVTPQLCKVALETSNTVTSIDFAEDVIETHRSEGVDYKCIEWNQFFEQNSTEYDNILTDGGLICLDFPRTWQRIAKNIYSHLRPKGIFAARIYISTDDIPDENYDNPNLNRFITSLANKDDNFMLKPDHPDYKNYDVRYALPPHEEVVRKFGKFALIDKLVPDYEAGEHFVSYAFQRT